jgi:GTPase SAR1 family protein
MKEEEKKKWAIKLAVLGDPAVGKTSLILQVKINTN